MILKDSQGKDRIKFSDIVRLNKEEPVFVKMKVRISTEIMISEEDLDIERSDLEDLIRNLKDLCEYKIRKFFFQNIDETIEIVFSINDIGVFYYTFLHNYFICGFILNNANDILIKTIIKNINKQKKVKKMKLHYLLIILLVACKDKCKNIKILDFPKDIKTMSSNKQICDNEHYNFGKPFVMEYNDENYSLFHYNEKIKILVDKRVNIILCIKTNEANNFDIIFNSKDQFTYGIEELIFLDKNLIPLYAIRELGIYQYTHDVRNKKIKFALIDDNKIDFNKIKYKDILNIYRNLKPKKISDKEYNENPNYTYPFAWEW